MTTTIRIIAGAIALLTLLPLAGAQASSPAAAAARSSRWTVEVDPAAAQLVDFYAVREVRSPSRWATRPSRTTLAYPPADPEHPSCDGAADAAPCTFAGPRPRGRTLVGDVPETALIVIDMLNALRPRGRGRARGVGQGEAAADRGPARHRRRARRRDARLRQRQPRRLGRRTRRPRRARAARASNRDLVEPIAPADGTLGFISKARHSIFYETPAGVPPARARMSSAACSSARSPSSASCTRRWTRTSAISRVAVPLRCRRRDPRRSCRAPRCA